MKLSIIIPVFNNWNFTKSALKDLSKLPDDHEIIVVDNGSDDDTCKLENPEGFDLPKNLVYIRNEDNLGFAKACNRGFAEANGEYICFLNNDIRVKDSYETWTQVLIDEASDGSLVGPTGGLLDNNMNFVTELEELRDGHFYMSGWNLTARKDIFESLIINNYTGPFSEEFGTYFEDTDLSFRASYDREEGLPMKIVKVPVFHFGKMTSRKVGISKLYLKAKTIFQNKWLKRFNN